MTCAGHCKHQPCPTAWDCAIQSKEGGEYVIHGEGHPLPTPERKAMFRDLLAVIKDAMRTYRRRRWLRARRASITTPFD